MDKAKIIHMLYTSNSLPNLTLDDMLEVQGLTHQKYRNWLATNNHSLYSLTLGLQEEINTSELSRLEIEREYRLTPLEVNSCLYSTRRTTTTMFKRERAEQMRDSGSTELDILNEGLPQDTYRLSDEITKRRADGDGVEYLASLYGFHPSRISQLDANAKPKKRLTNEEKAEIKSSQKSARDLATKYNVTVNTIYVVRREKQCKNI